MTPPLVRRLFALPMTLALAAALAGCGTDSPTAPIVTGPAGPALLLTFTSTRPPSPTPYITDLYMKNLSTSEPAFLIPNVNTPGNEGPASLSGDGRTLAFFTDRFFTGSLATVALYDVATGSMRIPNPLRFVPNSQNPTLSYDGSYLAYQVQGSGPFDQDIQLVDVKADTLVEMPNINEPGITDFDPSLSGDGKLLAFATNGTHSIGSFDIVLYSVPADSFLPLPNLNSAFNELSPSLSRDGRYIAFQTGNPALTQGLIDVEVYDRQTQSLLPLPGANTVLSEIQPVISPNGRYLAYTTESEGGRDIVLYDIVEKHRIPLTGVNDPTYYEEMPSLSDLPPVIRHPDPALTASRAGVYGATLAATMLPAHASRGMTTAAKTPTVAR